MRVVETMYRTYVCFGVQPPMNDMSRPPPMNAMRSKMMQTLTNMGFKREDAQNALISNNMNFDSALSKLNTGSVS